MKGKQCPCRSSLRTLIKPGELGIKRWRQCSRRQGQGWEWLQGSLPQCWPGPGPSCQPGCYGQIELLWGVVGADPQSLRSRRRSCRLSREAGGSPIPQCRFRSHIIPSPCSHITRTVYTSLSLPGMRAGPSSLTSLPPFSPLQALSANRGIDPPVAIRRGEEAQM